jgi:hypothetical protein
MVDITGKRREGKDIEMKEMESSNYCQDIE